MKKLIINGKIEPLPLDEQNSILYFPPTEEIHVINSVSKSILDFCDGTRDQKELTEKIFELYEGPREQIESDINSFVDEMLKKGIILEV